MRDKYMSGFRYIHKINRENTLIDSICSLAIERKYEDLSEFLEIHKITADYAWYGSSAVFLLRKKNEQDAIAWLAENFDINPDAPLLENEIAAHPEDQDKNALCS